MTWRNCPICAYGTRLRRDFFKHMNTKHPMYTLERILK